MKTPMTTLLRLIIATGVAVIQVRWLWAWAALDSVSLPIAVWQVRDIKRNARAQTTYSDSVNEGIRDIAREYDVPTAEVMSSTAIAGPFMALVLPALTIMNGMDQLAEILNRRGRNMPGRFVQNTAITSVILACAAFSPRLLLAWGAVVAFAAVLSAPPVWRRFRYWGDKERAYYSTRRRMAAEIAGEILLGPWSLISIMLGRVLRRGGLTYWLHGSQETAEAGKEAR
jgi:hypothetical protein